MKRSVLMIVFALTAIVLMAPSGAFAASSARNQGTLSEVDKSAIESMQAMMGDRADAQYAIGRLYERGGLDREAMTWMRKSAENGYSMAKVWMSEQRMKAEFRNSRGRMLAASRRAVAQKSE